MIKDVAIPDWLRGITHLKTGYQPPSLHVGIDTETLHGEPYTVQFESAHGETLDHVTRRNVTQRFLERVATYPNRAVFWCHNLTFDLPVLFYPWLREFEKNTFVITSRGVRCELLYGKVCHADLRVQDRSYRIIDTFAYFKTSLRELAKMLSIPDKLRPPVGLGEVDFRGTPDYEDFHRYAMRDAVIARKVGESIAKAHEQHDTALALSAPQFAARVFRRWFITRETPIPKPAESVSQAGILAYHGGKNGLYCKPGLHRGVNVYDINSAYPYAMCRLPNFCGSRIHTRRDYDPEAVGIWQVSGYSAPLTYNLLRTHDFKPLVGPFEKVWFTSYEIALAIEHGFLLEPEFHRGYVVEPGRGANALADYARRWFADKKTATGVQREFVKLLLNSLSGKFIQTRENDPDDEHDFLKSEFVAGGLFHPLIAALITGFTRAHLTKAELQFQSLHSSTDSIFTHAEVPTSKALGAWSLKARGTVLLLRPKLYLVAEGRKVVAHATHGFQGGAREFIAWLAAGGGQYSRTRMIMLGEARARNLKPLTMLTESREIRLSVPRDVQSWAATLEPEG